MDGPYSDNLKNLIYKLLETDPDKRPYAWEVLEMDFITEFTGSELSKSFKLDLPQGKLSKSGKHILDASMGGNSP